MDTLPQWLYHRFGYRAPSTAAFPWDRLDADDQLYWKHEAEAVRRAVARNGFKDANTLAAARKAQLQQHTT